MPRQISVHIDLVKWSTASNLESVGHQYFVIAKTLIEEEKINGNQLLALIKDLKPDLVSEKAIAAVAEVVKPTTNTQPTPAPATGA